MSVIKLFLCGDVMTGRGIDQILPYPGDPTLHESHLQNAIGYLALAEERTGPIPHRVDFPYIWGDALTELERAKPDVRIINLETSITRSDDYWKGKGVHYRMNPKNALCLSVGGIDCCSLANNHVLDWGYNGLDETLETLDREGIISVGAGQNMDKAMAPAALKVEQKGRVLVFAYGSISSGIPSTWAARAGMPGVNLLMDLSDKSVREIRDEVKAFKHSNDVVVFSIHWGSNWGYEISRGQIEFAHKLIDEAAVDIVHGHSSHHVKGVEVYNGKLILYGCGDFLNDYEGIGGYESFRGDLGLMYFASLDSASGRLVALQMIPTQIRHFRVNRASVTDATWLANVLNREGRRFGLGLMARSEGTRFHLEADNALNFQLP